MWRALLAVLGSGVAALGAVIALDAAVPLDARPWPEAVLDEQSVFDDLYSVPAPKGDWTLVIGSSGVYHGVDPAKLGVPAHKLTQKRGKASETAYALAWTLKRMLPPDRWPERVIWGVYRAGFVAPSQGPHPCEGFARRTRPDAELDVAIRPCEDFGGVRFAYSLSLFPGVRATEMRPMHQDLLTWHLQRWLGRAPPSPRPGSHEKFVEDSPRKREVALHFWREFGVFDGPISPIQQRSAEAIRDLLAERDIPLTMVRMPEHSATRAAYDPATATSFHTWLQTLSPRLIDLWDQVDDTGIADQAHPRPAGRERITTLLRRSSGHEQAEQD